MDNGIRGLRSMSHCSTLWHVMASVGYSCLWSVDAHQAMNDESECRGTIKKHRIGVHSPVSIARAVFGEKNLSQEVEEIQGVRPLRRKGRDFIDIQVERAYCGGALKEGAPHLPGYHQGHEVKLRLGCPYPGRCGCRV